MVPIADVLRVTNQTNLRGVGEDYILEQPNNIGSIPSGAAVASSVRAEQAIHARFAR